MCKTLIFANFDELSHALNISRINTGSPQLLFGHKAGPVINDIEGLYAQLDEKSCIRLISGTEYSSHLYRGQTLVHQRNLPSLARLQRLEQQLLALCRRFAFDDAIRAHPIVKEAEGVLFSGHPLYIDYEGIAQHHGFATSLLDTTCNFDVASFFATCSWNSDQGRYEPTSRNDSHGVIYRVQPLLINEMQPDSVQTVGWQPIPRPQQQRAFSVKLRINQDFTDLPSLEAFYFKHHPKISQRIWNAFDKGNVLFPRDAVAEVATQAAKLTAFSQNQVDRAWQQLMLWAPEKISLNRKKYIEKVSGIIINDQPSLALKSLCAEITKPSTAELYETLSRVQARMASYG